MTADNRGRKKELPLLGSNQDSPDPESYPNDASATTYKVAPALRGSDSCRYYPHASPDSSPDKICCDCGARFCYRGTLKVVRCDACGARRWRRAHRETPPRPFHMVPAAAHSAPLVVRLRAPASKRHPLYDVWSNMILRCHNPRIPHYASYGGRGITVCQRWRDSIDAFAADMGPRPNKATIERIDNDGGYEPSNCRWASRWEQGQNRRDTKHIAWEGVTRSIGAWYAATGATIAYTTFSSRLQRGWSPERAAQTPVEQRFSGHAERAAS